jgi:hypothetical protein
MPFAPTLNGTRIKEPTDLDVEKYKLTKAGRVASGKMTMDVIAKKRKFNFKYDVLSGTDLQTITDILFSDDSFYTLTYVENGVEHSAVVYVGAIKCKKFRTDGKWYWKDVEFALIEQ